MNSFYSQEELHKIGFLSVGQDVLVSRKASIYGADKIEIGDHSRIDDFCILSGKITIGKYVHISAHTSLYGGDAGIVFDNYSGISASGVVYAVSDDFSGNYMVNSTVPTRYRNVTEKMVYVGKYCQIAAGCIVLPGAILAEGSAVGAKSLVKGKLEPWKIYAGQPCKILKDRSSKLLEYVAELEKQD